MQKKGKEKLFLVVGSEAETPFLARSCLDFSQAWKMTDGKRKSPGDHFPAPNKLLEKHLLLLVEASSNGPPTRPLSCLWP